MATKVISRQIFSFFKSKPVSKPEFIESNLIINGNICKQAFEVSTALKGKLDPILIIGNSHSSIKLDSDLEISENY